MPIFTQAARCFVAIAQAGSIRKAAEVLNTSPSSVNRHLKQLEHEMKVDLFDRRPDGMQLTAAGELLLADLQDSMLDHNRTRNAIGALKGMGGGHLSLGVVECLAPDFAPCLIGALQKICPDMAFDLRVGRSVELAEKLSRGELDLIIAFNVPAFAEIVTEHISHWPVGLVSKDGGRTGPVTLEMVAEIALVQLEQSFGVQASLTERMSQSGLQMNIIGSCNSIAAVKGMVREGHAAAILTRLDVLSEIERGELSFQPLDAGMPLSEPLSVCMGKHRKLLFDREAVLACVTGMIEERVLS